jgi:hypothetical protein
LEYFLKTLLGKLPLYHRTAPANRHRKSIISPTVLKTEKPRFDNALIKALARAFRWRAMIENGDYASITELAKVESVNESYACKVLRLTLLAPSIVKAILDGTQPADVTITRLMKRVPIDWQGQLSALRSGES